MPLFHSVIWIDHPNAQVLQFDADQVQQARKVKAHTHHTRQHGSSVRTEHEFFGEVSDSLAGATEILVTGSHTVPGAEYDAGVAVERTVGDRPVDR